MYSVTVDLHFCYAHRLQGHAGKCRHLHGHNARVLVTVQGGELDDNGIAVDFAEIKDKMGAWIDENLDHRTILQATDPLSHHLGLCGEPVVRIDEPPSAENIARLIYDQFRHTFHITMLDFWETDTCCVTIQE